MIDALQPYPDYIDSGVEWLGEIPSHWQTPRLGALLRERGETNEGGEVTQVLSVLKDIGVIPYEDKGNIGNKRSEDITRYKVVYPDDIVVNCMNVIIGSVGLSRYKGCLSPVYYVLTRRHNDVDIRYINCIFQAKAFQQSLVRIGNGILAHRMRIPMELLKLELIPKPTINEQAAIVRYLDHADRLIRRYISAKRKLIALLNEQKQAIINQAVTRGLDPSVRLKPSGVEWLGDVPEHWEVVPLKNLATVQSGITLGKIYANQELVTFPYLRVANVQVGHFDLTEITTISIPIAEANRSTLKAGDVLMTEGGDPDKLGRGSVWQAEIDPCLHQNHVFAVRTKQTRLHSYFLSATLRTQYAKVYFLRRAKQTTNLASTNKTTIGQFPVVLPSLEEQVVILNQLDSETHKVDAVIENTKRDISLIQEYRTRLIADVVTGKVDVRGVAFSLPEEFTDVDLPDDTADLLDDESELETELAESETE